MKKAKPKKKILLPLSAEEGSLLCDFYSSIVGGTGRERDMFDRICRRIRRLGGSRIKYKFDAHFQGHVEITKR